MLTVIRVNIILVFAKALHGTFDTLFRIELAISVLANMNGFALTENIQAFKAQWSTLEPFNPARIMYDHGLAVWLLTHIKSMVSVAFFIDPKVIADLPVPSRGLIGIGVWFRYRSDSVSMPCPC